MLAHTYCVVDLVTNMQKKLYRKEIGKFGKKFTLLVCRAVKEFNCQKRTRNVYSFMLLKQTFVQFLARVFAYHNLSPPKYQG